MKDYSKVPCKRQAQTIAFASMKPSLQKHKVSALGGNDPMSCLHHLRVCTRSSDIVLYDLNVKHPFITNKDICMQPVTSFMDLDWEGSYKTCGNQTLQIFNRMQNELPSNQQKCLGITFCLRCASLENTVAWLNENIFFDTLRVTAKTLKGKPSFRGYVYQIEHTQETFIHSSIMQYRDTAHMLQLYLIW